MAKQNPRIDEKVKWEDQHSSWNTLDLVWEEVYFVLAQVGDSTELAIVEDLTPKKKKKFISLVLRRSGIKMYDETKENIKAKIDIKDIRFALNEVVNNWDLYEFAQHY